MKKKTSQEGMFYLDVSYGLRRVCYVRNGVECSGKTEVSYAQCIRWRLYGWAGVMYRGKTEKRIIDKGKNISSNIYIIKVLKHSLNINVT